MATLKIPLVIDMPPLPEAAVASRTAATWLERAIFIGLLAILMCAPLAFGATEPWGQIVQRMGAAVLFGLWAARAWTEESVEFPKNPTYVPALCFGLLIVLQFVSGLTKYRYTTLAEGLNLIPCGILILVAGELFTRRRRLHHFACVMAAFGFAVAVFAFIQDYLGATEIYWLVKVHAVSRSLYGPYVNHNHYAGLMEMLVPLAAAAAVLERGGKRWLLAFASLVMALSIVTSHSRGGMLGLLVSMIFVCTVLFRSNRQWRSVCFATAALAGFAGSALLLGGNKVLQRLTETHDKFRFAIATDSLSMWWHEPFLGFGWGTFSTVYRAHQSFVTSLLVNHAHNDYLELLVETGIVGFGIAVWFLTGVFRQGVLKLTVKHDRDGRVLALGLVTGIVALLVHSLLDFNLRIPANAALFYTLCAAVATPYRRLPAPIGLGSWEGDEPEPIEGDGHA